MCPSDWRGPHFLIDGVSSQPKRPQARGLFAHRLQFGLVLGHCLLALVGLLFFLEQRFRTALRPVGIYTQHGNPGKNPCEGLDRATWSCGWCMMRPGTALMLWR